MSSISRRLPGAAKLSMPEFSTRTPAMRALPNPVRLMTGTPAHR